MIRVLACVLVLGAAVSWTAPAAAQDWGLRRGKRPGPTKTPAPGKRPGKRPGVEAPPAARGETDPRRRMLPVLMDRYRRAVEGDARDGFALRRLLEVHRELHGSVDALVEEYRRRADADADPFVARMVLGHVEKSAARSAEALAAYRRAAEARTDSPEPLLAAAEVERATGDRTAARRDLRSALERITDRARRGDVLRTVVDLALEDGDLEAARGAHEEVVRLSPESLFVRMELGQALARRGRHVEAIEALQAVLPFARGDARASVPVLEELARAQALAGRLDDAKESVRRALRGATAGSGQRGALWEIYADIYRRQENLPELIRELAAQRGPEVRTLLARLYDEAGDDVHALAAYREALRGNPRDLDTRLRVIQILQRSGRLREVTEEYRTLVRVSPGEPRFVLELAEHLMSQGERDAALRLVEQAALRHGGDEAILESLAALYARWGEQERATRLLQRLARVSPNDPDHVIALGEQYDQQGQRERAVETWQRILQVIPDRAEARRTLADVLADHAMLSEAIALYREAVALRPDDLEMHKGLASALERNRDHAAAAEEWQRVLDLAGDDRTLRREARSRIVAIWHTERSLTARLRGLEQRFRGEPPDLEAGRFLGEAYLKSRRLGDAARVLQRVLEGAAGDVETHLALERVLVQQGDLAGAIDVCKRLAELDPTRAREFYERIAQYALGAYRDDEAVEYASRAVQLDPGNAGAHVRLAEMYRSRQDFDRAIEEYRRAIELDDRQFPHFFELAQLLLVRGRSGDADALYRQVLRRAPDDDLVARAARESIQIHEAAGSLGDLESELLPIALAQTRRPIYRRVLVELYASLAHTLVDRVRRGTDADRQAAKDELRRIGVRGLKPLLEALADADPAQKRAAIGVLGYAGNASAAAALFAAAEAEGDAAISSRALLAAISVADDRHTPRLQSLSEHREGRIRAAALWGLARIAGRRALPALLEGARVDNDTVRTLACDGLGQLGDASAIPLLATHVREARSESVRASAALALGRIGTEAATQALLEALPDARRIAGRAVAVGLGLASDPRATAALARASFSGDPDVRAGAAWALSHLGAGRPTLGEIDAFALPATGLEAGTFVTARLGSLPPAGPMHAALVRHESALGGALEAALSLEDPDVTVALGAMDSPTGVALAPFTDDLPAGAEREPALAAARRIAASAAPQIALLVRADDPAVRSRAVAVLGRVGGRLALEALSAAIASADGSLADESVLRLAVESLSQTDDPAAAAPLLRALETSRSWSVRTAAAAALGRLRAVDAVPALATALREDDYAFVRGAAAAALGAVASPQAAADLTVALGSDPEPRVRAASATALGRIGTPPARRALEAARDADPEVRRAIQGALGAH